MSYYRNFSIIIGNPLWRAYLRWRYQKSIDDFNKLNFEPRFSQKPFTALLCGVGNEVTAEEFINFVLSKNRNAKFWIIDLGKEQITAVKHMVFQKFPNMDIRVKQVNAFDLNLFINKRSINWIETDGLFEFLTNNQIVNLLKIWKTLLAKDGFATTTATSSRWKLQEFFDLIKIWMGKKWLGVMTYPHTRFEMRSNFLSSGFKYIEGPTPIPYFKRYSLTP